MNKTRMKPTTGRQSPSLFDKWHGIFYMPSRTDTAEDTNAFITQSCGALGGKLKCSFPASGTEPTTHRFIWWWVACPASAGMISGDKVRQRCICKPWGTVVDGRLCTRCILIPYTINQCSTRSEACPTWQHTSCGWVWAGQALRSHHRLTLSVWFTLSHSVSQAASETHAGLPGSWYLAIDQRVQATRLALSADVSWDYTVVQMSSRGNSYQAVRKRQVRTIIWFRK